MTLYEKMSAASKEYLRRLNTQNLTDKTLKNYQNVLKCFCEFLREHEQPDEFVAVAEWKAKLFENGLAPSSIKQYMIDLEIFFKALSHRSYSREIRFEENPIDKSLLPKVPERPYPVILTDEQIKKLYQNVPPAHYKQMWARTYAVLMILLNEKIRVSELAELRLSDLDFREHILVVRSGKGRKYREVDLTELSELAIEQYLNSGLRSSYLSDDDYLFGNTSSKEKGKVSNRSGAEKWHKFSANGLSAAVERAVEAITGVSHVRAHDLRKIGSRVCLNAGQSIEELQGQLGHSKISTTQIYTSRMGSKRNRDSARTVLSARDAAAEQLKRKNQAEQTVIQLYA